MHKPLTDSDRARFWVKTVRAGDCINWTAVKNAHGYGKFKLNGKMEWAHRVAYFMKFGSIAKGMLVCHRCCNPGCVNHEHLYLGTDKDNAADRKRDGNHYVAPAGTRAGSKNPHAKLDEEKVADIRLMLTAGQRRASIAALYGVSKETISSISTGRSWVK